MIEELDHCECDNTHKQNNTVCQWCWERGRREWSDPDVDADAYDNIGSDERRLIRENLLEAADEKVA